VPTLPLVELEGLAVKLPELSNGLGELSLELFELPPTLAGLSAEMA
jgi:hypothetical protein